MVEVPFGRNIKGKILGMENDHWFPRDEVGEGVTYQSKGIMREF